MRLPSLSYWIYVVCFALFPFGVLPFSITPLHSSAGPPSFFYGALLFLLGKGDPVESKGEPIENESPPCKNDGELSVEQSGSK